MHQMGMTAVTAPNKALLGRQLRARLVALRVHVSRVGLACLSKAMKHSYGRPGYMRKPCNVDSRTADVLNGSDSGGLHHNIHHINKWGAKLAAWTPVLHA